MSHAIVVLVRDAEHLARWKGENPALADLVFPVLLDEWSVIPHPAHEGLLVCHVIVPTESGTHPECARANAWAQRQLLYLTQEKRLAALIDRIREE